MQDKQSTNEKNKQKKTLLDISFLGILRAALGLPIEQPFQTLKTWMQCQNQSVKQSMRNIFDKKGFKGYYAGFGVNLVRVTSKSAYRWPLMVYLLDFYRKLAQKRGWGMSSAGVATGLATAIIQSVLVCPLERLKVWMMTCYTNTNYISFWKLKTIGSLFDGFGPVVLKQTISWVSFLGSQQYFKQKYYQFIDKDPKTYELKYSELMLISTLVCIVNTFMVMPADYVKTHFQKYTNEVKKQTFAKFVSSRYKTMGITGFYRGGTVKILHYNINALLTVPLMQKLLRSYSRQI